MLNQEMRTLTMSRHDMCRIRTALTSVMISFEKGTDSRKMWGRIREEVIRQIEMQDQSNQKGETNES